MDGEKRLSELERQKLGHQSSVSCFDTTIKHERQQIESAQREINKQNDILCSDVDAAARMRCAEV